MARIKQESQPRHSLSNKKKQAQSFNWLSRKENGYSIKHAVQVDFILICPYVYKNAMEV